MAACTADVAPPSTFAAPTPSTTVPLVATSTTGALVDLPTCQVGPGTVGLENEYERMAAAYNARNSEGLVALVGDGPVTDPSLDPNGPDDFGSIADWLDAAEKVGDTMSVNGLSPGDPIQLIAERRNSALEANGIDNLAVTFHFWTNQDCEYRVEVSDPISAPDPCSYYDVFGQPPPEECLGPFEPRAYHVAMWADTEVLIYGGISATTEAGSLATGLGFDPATGVWRELAPSPVAVSSWPSNDPMWTGEQLHVVGSTRNGEVWSVVVLTYTPETDNWKVSPPRPAEPDTYQTPGAAVWTGNEVVLAGGDINAASNQAWVYNPATEEWRQIEDMPTQPMEGVEAVVGDDTAYFVGGYPGAPAAALDLNTLKWRDIADMNQSSLEDHVPVWAGDTLMVVGGHSGPGQVDTVAIYDPDSDTWTASSPMPITASERTDAIWTGEELIVWGGYATYGAEPDSDGDFVIGDGAAYNPETDTWRILSESPLGDRCDHTLTWTGIEMLAFGGLPQCGNPNVLAYGDAALYDPESDSWRPTSP